MHPLPPHLDPKEPEDRSAARTLPRRRRCQRALRCSQGGGWKFEALLGEELDLRRVTWRLPPEVIPRLSASSGRSSDATELPRGPPDDGAEGGAGGAVGEGGGDRPARPHTHLGSLRPGCPLRPRPWQGLSEGWRQTVLPRPPGAEAPLGQAFGQRVSTGSAGLSLS